MPIIDLLVAFLLGVVIMIVVAFMAIYYNLKKEEIAQKITEKLNDVFELEKKAKEKWEEAKRLFEKMILAGVEDERAAKQHTLTSFTGVLN